MLKGYVKPITEYSESDLETMYQLMNTFYDNMEKSIFLKDFYAKDYCLSLFNEENELVGFTTQKVLEIEVDGAPVHGVFSGDTIIHKDYWGNMELFRVWSEFWFDYAKKYDEFYWFLICKGYKTYRMLPVFWDEYYPSHKWETPDKMRKIIDAYATALYPDEYNPATGVVEYKTTKDKLKAGVADIGEKELKRSDIAYFAQINPGYINGNDVACLARIDTAVLNKKTRQILFHES